MINNEDSNTKKNKQALKKWVEPTITKFNKMNFVQGGGGIINTPGDDVKYAS